MKNIGKWLLIAETAQEILEQETGSVDIGFVLSIACKKLSEMGYPCEESEIDFCIELNGKDILVKKQEQSEITSKKQEKIEHLRQEISSLKTEINLIKSLLPVNSNQENKGETTDSLDTTIKKSNSQKNDHASIVENASIQSNPIIYVDQEYKLKEPIESDHQEALIIDNIQNDEDNIHNINKPDAKSKTVSKQDNEEPKSSKKAIFYSDMTNETHGYKEVLKKHEFALSYKTIEIRQDNSSAVTSAEVIISPLSMKEGESDIIAWTNDNVAHTARISQNGRKSVLLHVGNVPLIVSGRVMNGQFYGTVTTTKKMENAGVSVSETEMRLTGDGHILIEDEGISVRVVPISDINRKNGNAEFVYAIIEKGKEPIVGDNINEEVHFTFHDTKLKLVARWKDDTLYAAVKPL